MNQQEEIVQLLRESVKAQHEIISAHTFGSNMMLTVHIFYNMWRRLMKDFPPVADTIVGDMYPTKTGKEHLIRLLADMKDFDEWVAGVEEESKFEPPKEGEQ